MADYDSDNIPVLNDIIEKESSSEKGSSDDVFDSKPGQEESLDVALNDENLDLFTADPVPLAEAVSNQSISAEDASTNVFEDANDTAHSESTHSDILTEPPLSENDSSSTIDEDTLENQAVIIDTADNNKDRDSNNFDTDAKNSETVINHNEFFTTDSTGTNDVLVDDALVDESRKDKTDIFEPAEKQPEVIESALIDYDHPDTERHTSSGIETAENIETTEDISISHTGDEIEQVINTPQIQQISLQPMVDDIIKQLLPDLEQQLRTLIQQALEDRLPKDIIKKED